MTSSDAQGMGRAGETVRRTFAMAAVNKAARGPLPATRRTHDNARVLRYLAKLTINPAIAHGIAPRSARSRSASWRTSCCGTRRGSAPSLPTC